MFCASADKAKSHTTDERRNTLRVLVIDPGGTTGLAQWEPTDSRPTFSESTDRFGLYRVVRAWRPSVVVCESFIPRPGALSSQPEALRIIGYLEGWAEENGAEFVLQSPSQAKSFGTAAKLKAVGWWPKGLGHAQDAARHLLVFLCTASRGREIDEDRTNQLLVEAL